MSKKFNSSEINKLISRHNDYLNKLNNAVNYNRYYESEIKKISENIVLDEAIKIISEISVDELNRDKKGIRINTLKANGINTIYNRRKIL